MQADPDLNAQMPGEQNEIVKHSQRFRSSFWRIPATILASALVLGFALFTVSLHLPTPSTENSPEVQHPNPTTTPCMPVTIDADKPPVSRGATQVTDISITEQENEDWSSLLFTRTFQTVDSPRAVLDYYQEVMPRDGWLLQNEPPEVTKTSGIWNPGVESEVADLPGVVGILGFFEGCPYSSAHYHWVYIVARTLDNNVTQIIMRIYERRD